MPTSRTSSSSAAAPPATRPRCTPSRANLNPLVIEGFLWGGLLQQTTDVENYPGFPEGIMGPELMQKFRDQAERFGTRFITDQATRVELADEPGGIHKVWVGDDEHQARTVILAMGAEHKKLGVPGEEELGGARRLLLRHLRRRVLPRQADLVVGGGDSAMEEAIFLAKFASKVTIVHRRDEFRASKIMLERARGDREHRVPDARTSSRRSSTATGPFKRIARLRNAETGETERASRSAARSSPSATSRSRRSSTARSTSTTRATSSPRAGRRAPTCPGVFAAGDLVDHTYRQAVTAAGSGCQAALDAEWYLRDTPRGPDARGHARGRPRRGPVGADALMS